MKKEMPMKKKDMMKKGEHMMPSMPPKDMPMKKEHDAMHKGGKKKGK